MAHKNKINFITLLRFNWHQIDFRLLPHSLSNFLHRLRLCVCVCVIRTIRHCHRMGLTARTNTKFINYNSMNGFVHGISIWYVAVDGGDGGVCGSFLLSLLLWWIGCALWCGLFRKVKMCGRVWHCHSYPSSDIPGRNGGRIIDMSEKEMRNSVAFGNEFVVCSQKLILNRFSIERGTRANTLFLFLCVFFFSLLWKKCAVGIDGACLATKNDFVFEFFLIHFVCDYTRARALTVASSLQLGVASCIRVVL